GRLPLKREGRSAPVWRAAHAMRARRKLYSLPFAQPGAHSRTIQPLRKKWSPRRRGERGDCVFTNKKSPRPPRLRGDLFAFYWVRSKSSRPDEPAYMRTSASRHLDRRGLPTRTACWPAASSTVSGVDPRNAPSTYTSAPAGRLKTRSSPPVAWNPAWRREACALREASTIHAAGSESASSAPSAATI